MSASASDSHDDGVLEREGFSLQLCGGKHHDQLVLVVFGVVLLKFSREPDDREIISESTGGPIQVIYDGMVGERTPMSEQCVANIRPRNCHQGVGLRIWMAIGCHEAIAFLGADGKVEGIWAKRERTYLKLQ